MKKLLSIVLLLPLVAFAEKSPADIDKELNATYQKIMQSKDADFSATVKQSQRIWLKGRNESCAVFLTDRGYDTDISDDCITTANEARLNFLKKIPIN